jgi:hypothetical protein
MIGGRSNQMVLLPCISSGSARIAWTRNYRQAPHQRARAPPGNTRQDLARASTGPDLDADTTLGQRLAPASPASNQAPSEAISRKGVKA